ncbi:phosphopantetheine-binding protein [Streptomonospora nanhaiensis]|uniref:acyl carrier protein n=1 Tax=Streptomonospora nanhaiensis TaxID=1323731 RepID=UPI003621FE8A
MRGAALDWRAVERDHRAHRRPAALPTYPFQRTRHWFAPRRPAPEAGGGTRPGAPPAPRPPAAAAGTARAASLAETAEALARETLRAARPIGPHDDLLELGMDSLMAAEFRERLQEASGRRLPLTLVQDHPTLAGLLAAVEEQGTTGDP